MKNSYLPSTIHALFYWKLLFTDVLHTNTPTHTFYFNSYFNEPLNNYHTNTVTLLLVASCVASHFSLSYKEVHVDDVT
jgi:hypothetical protein